jgi:hypothetical protein
MSTFWEPIMKKFTPLGALALAALIAGSRCRRSCTGSRRSTGSG